MVNVLQAFFVLKVNLMSILYIGRIDNYMSIAMIHIVYQEGWSAAFSSDAEVHFCSALLRDGMLSMLGGVDAALQRLINKSLTVFDDDLSLKGLLTFSDCEARTLGPFSVTSHFHMKVINVSLHGGVQLNVSPIYHLGLDYPDAYQRRQGKSLDPAAILGLVEVENSESCLYHYGIDAGVVFADNAVEHNKQIELQLSVFQDCLQATIHCQGQVSTQTVPLDELSPQLFKPGCDPAPLNVFCSSVSEIV